MTNILIRDVPDNQAKALSEIARQVGLDRHAYLKQIISEVVGDFNPTICWGYFKLTPCDVEPGSMDCPECGQDLEDFYFAIMGDMRLSGPVCSICASDAQL